LTLEVAESEGGIDEGALEKIHAQFDALQFLSQAANEGRDLSLLFISDLHKIITRHQVTYQAHDALGQPVLAPLHHGDWKREPNHVIRADGSLREYTPPLQVQEEMESLIEFYRDAADAHPVVRAAWLHHRFIIVHPFEDGNGRVARALVLLVLLGSHYAPLVVDRTRREDYIQALDSANDGDLVPLTRLFAELEERALLSELDPQAAPHVTGAVGVARAYADRLRSLRFATDAERSEEVARLAVEIQQRLHDHLESVGQDVAIAFSSADSTARATVESYGPPQPEALHWGIQLYRTAREVDFFTNLADGSWWARLHLKVLGQQLRYVAAVQKVGRGETGVLAVTVFAESVPPFEDRDEPRPFPTPLFRSTSRDSVVLLRSDEPHARWPEVVELVDRTLTAAVAEFGRILA
jgi:Fic/DOC family